MGYKRSVQETLQLATNYLQYLGRRRSSSPPFSRRWYNGFQRRNPTFKSINPDPPKIFTKRDMALHFDRLKNTLTKYNLLNRPHLIYNIDEKDVYTDSKASKPTSDTTILACGSATGNSIPPYFIFSDKTFTQSWMSQCPPGTAGTSKSDWSNSEILFDYLKNHLLKFIPAPTAESPILLILDGHRSHLNLSLLEWTEDKCIFIFIIAAHTSYFLQPLDIACFRSFEMYFIENRKQLMKGDHGEYRCKEDLCKLASQAYLEGLKPQNLINGFKKAGIVPFAPIKTLSGDNSDKISKS